MVTRRMLYRWATTAAQEGHLRVLLLRSVTIKLQLTTETVTKYTLIKAMIGSTGTISSPITTYYSYPLISLYDV